MRALRPTLGWSDAIDGLRNLALFAGLGAIWVTTTTAGRLGPEVRRATVVGFVLSALVELTQLFSPVRRAGLTDLATNTAGAFAGALGAAWLVAATLRARGARSYLGVPAFLLTGSYAVAVACEAVTPLFRSAPVPDAVGGPLARLARMLADSLPLAFGEFPWLDVLLYAPAGFLGVLLLAELGRDARRVAPWVAAVGAALAVGLEVGHGLLGLSIRWEAAAAHALALAAGAWAAPRWLPRLTQALRGAARARAVLGAYAALLGLWAWRPLRPRTDFAEMAAQLAPSSFIPLASVASRADVFSALHVLQQFFLYFPLGALVAVWPLARRGPWAHLRPALLLAVVLEAGHLFVAQRLFDLTNVLLTCAGLAVGWTIVRRSGFTPYGTVLAPR